MTALEAFDLTTHGGGSDFMYVARLCDALGPWCVIGGLAVNCYVEPVYTLDAESVIVADHLIAVEQQLMAAGFRVGRHAHSLNASGPVSDLVQGKVWAWSDPAHRVSKRK